MGFREQVLGVRPAEAAPGKSEHIQAKVQA